MVSDSVFALTAAAPVTPPRSRRHSPAKKTPQQGSATGLPLTPPSPLQTPSISRTWSIGSIPICFDGSSPKGMSDSPSFPSNADSPQPHRSPHTFGYHDDERTSGGVASHGESPSAALRRKWKGRTSTNRPNGDLTTPTLNLPSSHTADVHNVGLNIIGASPTQDGSPRTRKLDLGQANAKEGRFNPKYLGVGSLDSEGSDNDDALSLFSLSAYMRPDSICDDPVEFGEQADANTTMVVHETRGKTHSKATVEFRTSLPPLPSPLSISSSQETTTTDLTDDTCTSQGSSLLKVSRSLPYAYSNPDTPIVFAFPPPTSGLSPVYSDTQSSSVELSSTGSSLGFDEMNPKRIMLRQPSDLTLISPPVISKDVGRGRSSSSAGSASTGSHSRRISLIFLPPQIAFLRETTVELHIDQEGFRTIKPIMRLHRHAPSRPPRFAGSRMQHKKSPSTSSPASADDVNEYGDLGMAEFKMTDPETYIFHHAALDSSPTLRRVTINGNDNKDYISRQASLSLKGNGVYTVQGIENKGRLMWKFEYVVDNRRGPNGQDLPGERSFRPLSFSCSPLLLDPEHGKTIHLFQVVRKTVTPKLSSSKLKPPTIPISPTDNTFPLFDRTAGMSNGSISSDGASASVDVVAVEVPTRSRSRTLAGKRPSTPKRPGTARPADQQQQQPASVGQDMGLLTSSFSFTKARQRAASLSARPSTATKNAWRDLLPGNTGLRSTESQATSSGQRQSEDRPKTPGVRDLSAGKGHVPVSPGRIVTSAQIQAWMSSSVGLVPSPPPSLKPPRSARRPVLQQRPSTSANDGRPWGMI
ncbi:hypothetical protein FRB96_008492 [Tulasnella sp. 330]|nr:hypothetical protein FRB96_008492 [Tulasnella sp. 330]